MGFFSDLFGGDEGGIEQTSTLDPQQQAIYNKLSPYVKKRIGAGLPSYTGEFTAQPSQYEQLGLSKLGAILQGGLPATTQLGLKQYQNALSGMSPQETIDWYNEYIAPEERRTMAEEVIPGVREAYVGSGNYWGSPRMGAEAQAWNQYGTNRLSNIGQAIMSERKSARSMLPYLGEMSNLETGMPQIEAAMTYGALPRQIEQADLLSKFEEFKRTTPELSPILDLAMQLLNTTTTKSYYREGSPSIFSQIAPIAASLIGGGIGTAGGLLGAGGSLLGGQSGIWR